MAMLEYDRDFRDIIEDEMWGRLEQCIWQLLSLENILLESETTEHYYEEAKKRIDEARMLMESVGNSSEDAADERQISEALENAEQYLKLDIFRELALIAQNASQKRKEIEEKNGKTRNQNEDESNDEWVHILHLSDLHFGIYEEKSSDNPRSRKFDRTVETELFDFLKKYVAQKHKIDIVAITGDISYCHNEKGYAHFKEWLEKLCSEENLGIEIAKYVVMCPGNHDSEYMNRSEKDLIPKDYEPGSIGGIMEIDTIRNRQDQFSNFNKICDDLGIDALENFITPISKRKVPYVMGIKEIKGIYFVVLNSAWNSFPNNEQNGSDYGKLLLGRELIQSMFEDVKIPKDKMKVMLFHHPLAWLHEEEIRTYGKDQPNPSSTLVRRHADIILNGHIHGGIKPPDILENKTVVFTGGTLYTEDSNLNQFEIISVNKARHYCRQTVVCYNRQENDEEDSGWEIADVKYPSRIYYGICREIRDLLVRCNIGEVSLKEALREAFVKSKDVGLKMLINLLKQAENNKNIDRDIDNALQEILPDDLKESMGKTRTITKDFEEGEKQS